MRVACIQLTSGKNYKKNFNNVIKFINQAIKINADLILTPEATSFLSNDKQDIFNNTFKMSEDPLINKIKDIAKKNKKFILIGSIFVKEKKKLRNRSILINSQGKIQIYYDKINMFDVKISNKEVYNESKNFKPGNQLKFTHLPWGNMGLTICYDLRFPELYRDLSQNNLHFISVPSAFTKFTGKKHWVILLKARAIENFCYVFAPAQTGKNHNYRETFGHSLIVSPDGEILKIKKRGMGIIYTDVDAKYSIKLRKLIPSIKKYK
tara:strand:+ start:935 stop:1729 length:795 start_codon:yes stop_codon:yes gene_type:complete